MENANYIKEQSLNWLELKYGLESVIKSIKTDSEVKQESVLALDEVKDEDKTYKRIMDNIVKSRIFGNTCITKKEKLQ